MQEGDFVGAYLLTPVWEALFLWLVRGLPDLTPSVRGRIFSRYDPCCPRNQWLLQHECRMRTHLQCWYQAAYCHYCVMYVRPITWPLPTCKGIRWRWFCSQSKSRRRSSVLKTPLFSFEDIDWDLEMVWPCLTFLQWNQQGQVHVWLA